MLSIHRRSSRHCVAESRLKERALMRNNEINKRLALPGSSVGSIDLNKRLKLGCKSLNEHSRKSASQVLGNRPPEPNSGNGNPDMRPSTGLVTDLTTFACPLIKSSDGYSALQQWDLRERRERELKFTEAGWKRECHGKWYKDENVEFDSDEEDPNVCVA